MSATALAGVADITPSMAFGQATVPPAVAQEQQADAGQTEGDSSGQIVATGTRIRHPNLESTEPITSVSGEKFFETGRVSVGDILNDLPISGSRPSCSTSTRGIGAARRALPEAG